MTMTPLAGYSQNPSSFAHMRPRPVVVALTFAGILTGMLVSPFLLDSVGYIYGSTGGSPLTKVHPMTYLAVLAFLSAAISRGNPLAYLAESVERFPGTAYFIVMLVFMILWTLLIQRQPLTSLIDTFLPAALFIFLISDLTAKQHRILTILIHIIMNANAFLGVFEVSTGWRLTPITLEGSVVEWEWRATAFLGHPLENALMSSIYLVMMTFGADRSVSPAMRIGIISLQVLGLIVFGGRTAMVLGFMLLGVRIVILFFSLLRGRTFDPRLAGLVVMAIPVVIGLSLIALDLGLLDRMIDRFTNDGGSADTRLTMVRIFNSFSLYDLLMGPDPVALTAKMYAEGTQYGIESFIFGFFLQSGVLISIIFFFGLAAITYDLWRIGSRICLLHIALFYTIAAGAASLSVKGQSMTQFVILFCTIEALPSLMDRDPA